MAAGAFNVAAAWHWSDRLPAVEGHDWRVSLGYPSARGLVKVQGRCECGWAGGWWPNEEGVGSDVTAHVTAAEVGKRGAAARTPEVAAGAPLSTAAGEMAVVAAGEGWRQKKSLSIRPVDALPTGVTRKEL